MLTDMLSSLFHFLESIKFLILDKKLSSWKYKSINFLISLLTNEFIFEFIVLRNEGNMTMVIVWHFCISWLMQFNFNIISSLQFHFQFHITIIVSISIFHFYNFYSFQFIQFLQFLVTSIVTILIDFFVLNWCFQYANSNLSFYSSNLS